MSTSNGDNFWRNIVMSVVLPSIVGVSATVATLMQGHARMMDVDERQSDRIEALEKALEKLKATRDPIE